MKLRLLSAALFAVPLTLGTIASAQAQDRRDDRGRDQDQRGRVEQRHDDHNDEWRRGGRVPAEYHNRHYVVDDWKGHHLTRPPRGYHWVQHGNDYALVAITSGIISQLLSNPQ